MLGGAWRVAMLGLAVATAALTVLAVERISQIGDDRAAYALDMTAAGLGLLALWVTFAKMSRHFRDLGRLRDALSSGRGRPSDEAWLTGRQDEVGQLAHLAIAAGPRADRAVPGRSDKSLSAVLALAEEPFALLDEGGRVERLNAAAARLLDGAEPGGDIGQFLIRADLARAIERARGAGDAVTAVLRRLDGVELSARVADLGLNAGMVLVFPQRGQSVSAGGGGKRALTFRSAGHPMPLGDDDPLAALPFVVLWVATAGAEPGDGAVVAIGTMRLVGARVFRTVSLSLLVNPAEPITAEATRRHGVDTERVAGERPFAAVWPTLAETLHHCVVVGVGVDAALSALTRACVQAGLPPVTGPALDLGALAVALEPTLAGASLDQMASFFAVKGALPAVSMAADPFAQVRVQAELAAALLTRLAARGVVTHRQARVLMTQGASAHPRDNGEPPPL
jgi:DNA polymerase III subunit epsilon